MYQVDISFKYSSVSAPDVFENVTVYVDNSDDAEFLGRTLAEHKAIWSVTVLNKDKIVLWELLPLEQYI